MEKTKYVPLEKRSKREKKEYYEAQRQGWGSINPITRRTPNLKAYKRKKSGWGNDYEPCPDFLSLLA